MPVKSTISDALASVLILYFIARDWNASRKYSDSMDQVNVDANIKRSKSMMVRVAIFISMPLLALGLAAYVAVHKKNSSAKWNIFLVSRTFSMFSCNALGCLAVFSACARRTDLRQSEGKFTLLRGLLGSVLNLFNRTSSRYTLAEAGR